MTFCFMIDGYIRGVSESAGLSAAVDAHRAGATQYDWSRGIRTGIRKGN